jgi:hypothetical protein
MSQNPFDPFWKSKVTVPVKRVGGVWEFFYGGGVPIKDGALGELTVNADEITDADFHKRLTQELTVKILNEGSELLVGLSDPEPGRPRNACWPDPFPFNVPMGITRFEPVTLGPLRPGYRTKDVEAAGSPERGGLFLKLKGLERCELFGSTVYMPHGFLPRSAVSLNHALTLLSQEYETHRISHSGNVYSQVYYRDGDGRWYPLDDLRKGVQAQAERSLLNEAWSGIAAQLGWSPLPKPEKKDHR